MKDKIIELLKQYEDAHTQGVYRCDYDELAEEVVKLFLIPPVISLVSVCSRCEKKPKHKESIYCIDCLYERKMSGY